MGVRLIGCWTGKANVPMICIPKRITHTPAHAHDLYCVWYMGAHIAYGRFGLHVIVNSMPIATRTTPQTQSKQTIDNY